MPAHLTKTECPIQGHPVLPNKQARALQVQQDDCQQNQNNSVRGVHYISMTQEEVTTETVQYSKEPSTDIVYKQKKRLAKSGKDIPQMVTLFTPHGNSIYIPR